MKWLKSVRHNRDKWHKWFAWHPITIKDGDGVTEYRIWLQSVLRKQRDHYRYSRLDRIFMLPDYDYKESILDLFKDD